jgi:hypothetical protein
MINCSKTIVIVENKRGPQGGITDNALAALGQMEELKAAAANKAAQSAASASQAAVSATLAATKARDAGDFAQQAQLYAQTASLVAEPYDPEKTYGPPDMAVVNGQTYRCLSPSTGESPPGSLNWVLVAAVIQGMFELDEIGDIMPRNVFNQSIQWEIDGDGGIMPIS